MIVETMSRLLAWPSEDLDLPLPGGEVRTVRWGQEWQYCTPAYWVAVTRERVAARPPGTRPHRLADTLRDEVVACLLGGHGITYEMNVAAFDAISRAEVLDTADAELEARIEKVLRIPLAFEGRSRRYRYPMQRAQRVGAALRRLEQEEAPTDPMIAREWLMTFVGVGPKTASWIVRNQYPDSHVAIIDIHVHRAAVKAGVFDPSWAPSRDYWTMEAAFLGWARHGEVTPADLDAVIWEEQAAAARRPAALAAV